MTTSNTRTQERMEEFGDEAKDTARRTQQGAKDAAQNLTSETADAFRDVGRQENPVEGFVQIWEKVPTNAYFLAAAGSILLSALLMLSGKQRAAIFVGQWPPTMIALALMNKLLRPSQEIAGRSF